MANQFSYVKDTSHLLTLLHNVTLPPNTLLITLDIEALYTSIPHTRGLQTINKILSSRPLNKRPHNRFIIELLEFLLKNNKFKFNYRFFCQSQGTAIGSKCALAYANI